ncbi:hypothetical protein [Ktedonobacter robiniae]|uniref:Uncharacterized protein n=1 Tax=Ktedonobacter robiniae TaxID=2778365 RepID=A0ABQ3URU0_9CHLR|nr:hypothetical protein [Ktedonobacter robiniae]GHO55513.1 hypothetical protein KSB_39880 [Ktedonobacter robiniae]
MRVFRSAALKSWKLAEDGSEALDEQIIEVLRDIGKVYGKAPTLVDFHVSKVTTNWLPPHYDEYLTVLADI